MNLVLNNLKRLIYHKNPTNHQPTNQPTDCVKNTQMIEFAKKKKNYTK